MRQFIPVLCVLASTVYALDSGAQPGQGSPSAREYCKVEVHHVGDTMPAGSYQGQCLEGRPDGKGEVIFNNGDRLQGEFKKGLVDGTGTWISGSSGNRYSGSWRGGRREGEGTYSWSNGAQQYVGEWVEDKRQGRGVFTWANGDRFEGEFRNNRQYNGTYTSADGRVHTCYMGLCR